MAGHFYRMEPKTLFVSNINYETTPQGLRDGFVRFGNVTGSRILTDRFRGKALSRGIGFVEFEKEEECTAALEHKGVISIDRREVRVQKARVRAERKRDTAFVGGVPEGATPDDLKAAFKDYNPVDARIARRSGAPTGFGFVKFATSADQERAVRENRTLTLKGSELIVRFARRDFDAPPPRRQRYANNRPPRRAPRGTGTAPAASG
jgi:RNA recognition motif-containing protein